MEYCTAYGNEEVRAMSSFLTYPTVFLERISGTRVAWWHVYHISGVTYSSQKDYQNVKNECPALIPLLPLTLLCLSEYKSMENQFKVF